MLYSLPKVFKGIDKTEQSVFSKIKGQYLSEKGLSFAYFEPKIGTLYPDFIIIDPNRGVSIIEVKAWDLNYIKSMNQKEVTASDGKKLENPAYKTRRYHNTAQNIFSRSLFLSNGNRELNFKLSSILLLKNIKRSEAIEHGFLELLDCYPTAVIFQEDFNSLELPQLFPRGISPIEPSLIDEIRGTIFPEIQIHPIQKRADSFQQDRIVTLDMEQERSAKNISDGHYIITGVPGSGKTVILIARAIHLAKIHQDWQILLVTYNKSLTSQLQKKIEMIREDMKYQNLSLENIKIKTFHQVAKSLSELSQNNHNKDEYWDKLLPEDAIKNAVPTYDAVLVDEYQDFRKNWFELLIKLLKIKQDDNGKSYTNLFMAGDRLQSIYNPKDINWKQDIGLDMRGRSTLLKNSYRTTKDHIELGLSILKSNNSYKKEIDKFYEKEEDLNSRNSLKDSIELLESDYKIVVKKIESLLKNGYEYRDIMILTPDKGTAINIQNFMPKNLKDNSINSKDITGDNKIFISTYHSSKGIERKVVFAIKLDQIEDQKLLYVASTRASEKLILHSWNFQKNDLVKVIYKKAQELGALFNT